VPIAAPRPDRDETTVSGDTLRVVLPYVVVAGLWIYFSDAVLGRLAPDAAESVYWSTVKGFAFVAVTGALLHGLLRRILLRQRATADALRESIDRYQAVAGERERAEAALRHSEHRFRAVVESAPDSIMIQAAGRFVYLNPAAVRLFGASSAEALVGSPVLQYFDPGCRERVDERIRTIKDLRQPVPLAEERVLRCDGQGVDVEVLAVPFEHGGQPAALVFARDITERRSLEARFLRAQRLESLGQLAGGIAHDLNNVLLPVFMGIEQLQESTTDPASLEILGIMMASARRGSQVVQQVLTFARGTRGERRVLELTPLVREITAFGRETFPRSINLVVNLGPDLATVLADAAQIHQVLLNLCVNARDAMPSGGTMTVEARTVAIDERGASAIDGASAGVFSVLSVVDTGVGMDPATAARIFDPFFTTKAPGQGTGLGLSTVHGIVKSHGGFIEVDSQPGKGTRFSVYLPAASGGAALAPSAESDDSLRGNGECILVADDEEAIRTLSAKTLERFGYAALTASDGAELLAVWADHKREIACVITDMMMPVMDGPAAIRALRRAAPDLPIIAVSGLTSTSADVGGLGVHHLLKPYDRSQLLALLRRVLADRPAPPHRPGPAAPSR
jgi:two-component system, cell cycle sensor histidine kinase and response regulator CckA